jgi:hypothetical protein
VQEAEHPSRVSQRGAAHIESITWSERSQGLLYSQYGPENLTRRRSDASRLPEQIEAVTDSVSIGKTPMTARTSFWAENALGQERGRPGVGYESSLQHPEPTLRNTLQPAVHKALDPTKASNVELDALRGSIHHTDPDLSTTVSPDRASDPQIPIPISKSVSSTTFAFDHMGQATVPVSLGEMALRGIGRFDADIGKLDGYASEELHLHAGLHTELKSGAVSNAAAPFPGSRNDAVLVIRQLVMDAGRLQDGPIEIRLSPEELGSVRMQLVTSDAGLTVHVHADRPETLDLLRRHAEMLARELASAGYETAGFSFSGEGGKSGDKESRDTLGDELSELEAAQDANRAAPEADGIDIRL